MDQNFTTFFITGYTGEFQLIGALYRNGLDALRPPADMGVDVVTGELEGPASRPICAARNAHVSGETAVVTVQEAGRACAVIRRCISC